MPRVKISEFRAKQLLGDVLGYEYGGVSVDLSQHGSGSRTVSLPNGPYAVKVDQATKKRNQNGLVRLDCGKEEIEAALTDFKAKGFRYALIEPMVEHRPEEESFLALQRTDKGVLVQYSEHGGVDIESHAESLQSIDISNGTDELRVEGLDSQQLNSIIELFDRTHMVYLEINPLLVRSGRLLPLDAAVEVDSAALLAVKGAWTADDFRDAVRDKTASEEKVAELQASSSASLTLRVLNPDGRIFLLLSGGGASVVVADEFAAHGLADDIADYGEYSGSPNEDEMFSYTSALIDLMKRSSGKSKVLVVAGGIANFTDVAVTFKGLIRAFEQNKDFFVSSKIPIFVRRGGPNQAEGLRRMREFLDQAGIENQVHGPELSIADIVKKAAERMN